MLDLGPEYRIEFEHEFDASQESATSWTDYLAIEDGLQAELTQKIDSKARNGSKLDRYAADSLTFPGNFTADWNRSFEITATPQKGVAVLLHGLTDSPFTMLATAQTLAGAGYSVVVPRMPGHGFAVGGLVQARNEDWSAAVRIAARHATTRLGDDQPLLLAGYSNGALLALEYSLQCDTDDELHCPDRLVFFSPAIAVTSVAAIANTHIAISWLPYFEKYKWNSILPEIDPFKFTSFPKQAASEIYAFSQRIHKTLAQPGEAAKLPPILTFQSLVDNTVTASAIISILYSRLPNNGSDLVVYDVNRSSTILSLMKTPPIDPLAYFKSAAPMHYGVTILGNRDQHSAAINLSRLQPGETEVVTTATKLAWPTDVFSLSHIAIPFAPNDVVYGDGRQQTSAGGQTTLGAIAPRGERGVLVLTPDYFLRARHNPFYAYQANYLSKWVEQPLH